MLIVLLTIGKAIYILLGIMMCFYTARTIINAHERMSTSDVICIFLYSLWTGLAWPYVIYRAFQDWKNEVKGGL